MCSVVIFAKPDNDHPDPALDWTKFKRGDVIDINDDDNFFWGSHVQGDNALGWWNVIVVPGVAANDIISLCMGDPIPFVLPALYRIRVNSIDLDGLLASPSQAQSTSSKSSGSQINTGIDNTDVSVAPDLVTDTDTLLSFRSVKPPLE